MVYETPWYWSETTTCKSYIKENLPGIFIIRFKSRWSRLHPPTKRTPILPQLTSSPWLVGSERSTRSASSAGYCFLLDSWSTIRRPGHVPTAGTGSSRPSCRRTRSSTTCVRAVPWFPRGRPKSRRTKRDSYIGKTSPETSWSSRPQWLSAGAECPTSRTKRWATSTRSSMWRTTARWGGWGTSRSGSTLWLERLRTGDQDARPWSSPATTTATDGSKTWNPTSVKWSATSSPMIQSGSMGRPSRISSVNGGLYSPGAEKPRTSLPDAWICQRSADQDSFRWEPHFPERTLHRPQPGRIHSHVQHVLDRDHDLPEQLALNPTCRKTQHSEGSEDHRRHRPPWSPGCWDQRPPPTTRACEICAAGRWTAKPGRPQSPAERLAPAKARAHSLQQHWLQLQQQQQQHVLFHLTQLQKPRSQHCSGLPAPSFGLRRRDQERVPHALPEEQVCPPTGTHRERRNVADGKQRLRHQRERWSLWPRKQPSRWWEHREHRPLCLFLQREGDGLREPPVQPEHGARAMVAPPRQQWQPHLSQRLWPSRHLILNALI